MKNLTKVAQKKPRKRRENERWNLIHEALSDASLLPIVRNSYVLSRFWAWWSRVQLSPEVRIPVPRFLSTRDP